MTAKTGETWTHDESGVVREIVGTNETHVEFEELRSGGRVATRRAMWKMWTNWEQNATMTTAAPAGKDLGGTLSTPDPPDDFSGFEAENSKVSRAEMLAILEALRITNIQNRAAALNAMGANLAAGLDARTGANNE